MTQRHLLAAGLLATALTAATLVSPAASQPAASPLNGWEYKIHRLRATLPQIADASVADHSAAENDLQTLGRQGWELITVEGHAALFKRPRR